MTSRDRLDDNYVAIVSSPYGEIEKDEGCNVSSDSSSITVTWSKELAERTASPKTINSYAVKFRVLKTKLFTTVPINKENNTHTITCLKPSTVYEINVYWCNEDDECTTLYKRECLTDLSKVEFMMETAISDRTKEPVIHHLQPVSKSEHHIKVNNSETDSIRVLDMIAERIPNIHSSEEKTVLLLGGTGTGKSTMIDALINFIADVSYTDEYRFSLICKTQVEKIREDKQSQSQTSSVTVYRIPRIKGLKIKCGVNIIDTPGFNDTRPDFDKRITVQIKELFDRRINHVDAILIVLPLSTTRLTDGQKFIFSRILDMFGEDVKDHIFVTFTHDDSGKEASCLSLLTEAGVPYKDFFRFNNATVLSEFTSSEDNINIEFWKKRTDNFSKLFQYLETTRGTTITSSIGVMRARTMLEIQLKALENVLSQQAQYMANYKEDMLVLHAIEKECPEKRKECKYSRLVPETVEKDTTRESLNCLKCRITCHKKCLVPLNLLGWTCESMTDGKCTVCDGKCEAADHVLRNKIFKVQYETEWISGEAVAARNEKREETFNRLKDTIRHIEHCITEINSKALIKDTHSVTQYIANITNKEMKKKSKGYDMRIKIHKNILRQLQEKSIPNLSLDNLMNF